MGGEVRVECRLAARVDRIDAAMEDIGRGVEGDAVVGALLVVLNELCHPGARLIEVGEASRVIGALYLTVLNSDSLAALSLLMRGRE